MVDVWEKLGRAIGHLFKPPFELPGQLWKSLAAGASDLMRGLLSDIGTTKDATKATVAPYMAEILDEAATSVGPGSPPKEIEEADKKLANALLKKIDPADVGRWRPPLGSQEPKPKRLVRVLVVTTEAGQRRPLTPSTGPCRCTTEP
jgi:hypothetical protein